MAVAHAERDSHTELRNTSGFRAELPGLDLPSLLQLVCMSREQRVVRVGAAELQGFFFVREGRPVHALVEGPSGELTRGVPAALHILTWQSGDVCLCDRAFPTGNSMDVSIEELLLRSAQASDEAQTNARGVPAQPAATTAAKPVVEAIRTNVATLRPARVSEPAPQAVEPRATIPPPLPARDTRTASPDEPLASARLDMNGRLVSTHGNAQLLAQLVAYLTRMAAIVAHHLALEPFEALEAELGALQLVVYVDGADMVGVLMPKGAAFNELRQQLSL